MLFSGAYMSLRVCLLQDHAVDSELPEHLSEELCKFFSPPRPSEDILVFPFLTTTVVKCPQSPPILFAIGHLSSFPRVSICRIRNYVLCLPWEYLIMLFRRRQQGDVIFLIQPQVENLLWWMGILPFPYTNRPIYQYTSPSRLKRLTFTGFTTALLSFPSGR